MGLHSHKGYPILPLEWWFGGSEKHLRLVEVGGGCGRGRQETSTWVGVSFLGTPCFVLIALFSVIEY